MKFMNKNLDKPIVFCGVLDMNGEPVKMSKEEQEQFTKKVSGDEFNAVFCEDNFIPKLMESMTLNKKSQ